MACSMRGAPEPLEQSAPSGFQHERSAKCLDHGLHRGSVLDAAEVADRNPSSAKVLLLQELVLRCGSLR